MEATRTEGIILHSQPIKDWDLLITVFTRDFGVMKFYYKNGQSRKRSKGAITSPLTCAEFLFYKRESDLVPLNEVSIIDVNLDLRKTLECLQYSCAWLKLIKLTQLPEKPSTDLYQILKTYLGKLPTHSNPKALHGSFHLKLLKYDGLIALSEHCSICRQPATFQSNETFCKTHRNAGAIPFNTHEWESLQKLIFSRSLKQIESEFVSEAFLEKIIRLYEHIYHYFST